MDSAGRLVIPKPIRAKAGFVPNQPVEVRYEDGRISIEPVSVPVRIVRSGRLFVAKAARKQPLLGEETVRRTRDRTRTRARD
jgi:AbrB family looped-hinge helix DNA binding protein